MLRVMNIRTGVPMKKTIEALVAKKLRCSPADIEHICVVRRSVDARRKPNIYLVFTVDVAFHDEEKIWRRCRDAKDVRRIAETAYVPPQPGDVVLRHRPVVVGTRLSTTTNRIF